jgi:isochorismate synthase
MLAPVDTPNLVKAQLLSRLHGTLPRMPLSLRGGFASLTLALPEFRRSPPALSAPHFLLAHARRDDVRAGYGIAAEWRTAGPGRLHRLRAEAVRLKGQWHQVDPDGTGMEGFAFVGFSAVPATPESGPDQGVSPIGGGLPEAMLWLPEIALRRHRGRAALVLTTGLPADRRKVRERWSAWLERLVPWLYLDPPGPLDPAPLERRWADPNRDLWDLRVGAALAAIADGTLDKVVLARRLCVRGSRLFDPERLAAALADLFPSCQTIRLHRGGRTFVAATPERLLAQQGERVEVDAIAGTATRAAGSIADAALGETLRNSRKDLHEHALVTRSICAALAPHSRHLDLPERPRLVRLNNAQHLWTPIRAELKRGMDALALADLLHPTPATNGHPRSAAQAWIHRTEPQGRGWYTGAAGCLEPDLSGELWVLLRCAEIDGDTAVLHAGAGIVDGSDPADEWRETEDKFAAMLSALPFA